MSSRKRKAASSTVPEATVEEWQALNDECATRQLLVERLMEDVGTAPGSAPPSVHRLSSAMTLLRRVHAKSKTAKTNSEAAAIAKLLKARGAKVDALLEQVRAELARRRPSGS